MHQAVLGTLTRDMGVEKAFQARQWLSRDSLKAEEPV